ncbi:enamine deaminase RidA (YjgF/YER057c/UK114 family) [Kibdelosporangium banguiense]|uniref:Enamine deaminase RidA (YjgF/YER057c/UK114 family) n=1 Tax=Kibdelosporangium banguiense TaxID=1365924 RepID=A0ABS4U192_9PSEU|nr:RidA family protein [Kibdelosporangium banguiense]MBP2330420.1 enamine deaminase RidA (YjgF/YER057c/UK114 family) [Kibdelosporangium banguiense]
MSKRTIDSDKLPRAAAERFHYSIGVQAGSTLWISGQVALRDGAIIGENDVEAQTVQVFDNIREVLAAAGAGFDALVSTTTYMTARAFSAPINDVRGRYLTGPVNPTSTLLVVAGLARPEFLVEISAVAVLDA